jgi:hypothetical protein
MSNNDPEAVYYGWQVEEVFLKGPEELRYPSELDQLLNVNRVEPDPDEELL